MRQFLIFIAILILIMALLARTKSIEPIESFEQEKILWRIRSYGRSALDTQPSH